MVKNKEQALESIMTATAVIDAIGDGIILFKLDGEIISINPALAKMIGVERSEADGKNLIEVMANYIKPEDPEIVMDALNAGLKGEVATSSKSFTLVSRDGREIPVMLTGSTMKDAEGKIIALIGVIKDVTELKRVTEEMESYSKELEEKTKKLEDSRSAMIYMMRDLKRTSFELEKKIRDLERFQKVTMDREKRVLELKKEIKEMKKQLEVK